MDYKRMTNEALIELLEEKGINYSGATKKDEYIELLNNMPDGNVESVENSEPEDTELQGLVGTIKSALKVEKTVTKSKEDPTAYLKGRDYGELTAGERIIIREKSVIYESADSGVTVKVNDRLATNWRIVKLADTSYSKLLKGETYVLSQEDFDVLRNEKVKVKTEATKNKCCGQARYEEVPLLEVAND